MATMTRRTEMQLRRDRTLAGLAALADHVGENGDGDEALRLRAAYTLATILLQTGRKVFWLEGDATTPAAAYVRMDCTARQTAVALFKREGTVTYKADRALFTGHGEAKAVRKARDMARDLFNTKGTQPLRGEMLELLASGYRSVCNRGGLIS
jgi:hypothetical protein